MTVVDADVALAPTVEDVDAARVLADRARAELARAIIGEVRSGRPIDSDWVRDHAIAAIAAADAESLTYARWFHETLTQERRDELSSYTLSSGEKLVHTCQLCGEAGA